MQQLFTGLLGYPITPLKHDDEPDLGALAHLVGNCALAGLSGVTVLATSGAGVTFNRAERESVVLTAVEVASRVANTVDVLKTALPVYAAVSAPSTLEIVALAKDAERAGVAGLVLAPFSYLPLSDAEVRTLFLTLSEATSLPICFYNKPAQTQYDLSPDTLAYLAVHSNVVAVKETMRRENVAARVQQLREAVGTDFSLGLSSDVQLLAELPTADAWHTGLAALLPGDYVRVWQQASAGKQQGAELSRLQRIAQSLAGMPHPIGALHALSNVIGVPTQGPRGPYAAATQEETWQLGKAANGSF
ncbi:dihydrodipicolinate synthase family protein [Arthrobacter sp. Sr24]